MAVVQLQDSALFSVAIALYEYEFYKPKFDYCWKNIADEALKSVSIFYPWIPKSVEKNILKTITLIGSELSSLAILISNLRCITREKFDSITFDKVYWTSCFTINRMKTVCALSRDCVTVDNAKYPIWLELCWMKLTEANRFNFHLYFDKYSLHVFYHWMCYRNHYFWRRCERVTSVDFNYFRDIYINNTAIENVFRYSVITSDVYMVTIFYSLLPVEARKQNVVTMATLIIKSCKSFNYYEATKTELVTTFLFLWQNLRHFDRMSIVQEHFTRFFEFLLSFPGTDSLVHSVNWYRPSNSRKANRKFLEKAAAEISLDCTELDKYRNVFLLLFNKVEMMLCEIDVVSLLERLLSVKDIHSSVLMMKAMDTTKKKKILDVSHKIWQDLWREFIDFETFMTFLIEARSEILQEEYCVNYD